MEKRRIILRSISTVAVASATGIPLPLFAAAEKVDPSSEQAKSLGYTEDTKLVNKQRYPKHAASQRCDNCQFFQAAQREGNYAPCTIFGGKAVAAGGWCSAWMAAAATKSSGASGSAGTTSSGSGSDGTSGSMPGSSGTTGSSDASTEKPSSGSGSSR